MSQNEKIAETISGIKNSVLEGIRQLSDLNAPQVTIAKMMSIVTLLDHCIDFSPSQNNIQLFPDLLIVEQSSLIPSEVQDEIENAVTNQIGELPDFLQVEWHQPKLVRKQWLQEASQYIDIPHQEYWSQ